MSSLLLRVAFEGGYDQGTPTRFELREGFGTHEIAILDFPLPQQLVLGIVPEMTPLAIRWGYSPLDVRTFYGYVNHHETQAINDASPGQYLRVFCIGSSQPLNSPYPGSWSEVTGSFIAKQVATRHSLRALVHTPKTVIPFWSPGRDSDFAMMNRLAEYCGYRFWVSGSTLYFLDPRILLQNPAPHVPEYSMDNKASDTLTGIQVVAGSLAPRRNTSLVQKVFGIDDGSGSLIQATSARQYDEAGLTKPGGLSIHRDSVDSLAEAHRITEASSGLGEWNNLSATLVGDGRTRIGGLVDLQGNILNNEYAGTWLCNSAVHIMEPQRDNRTQFTTQVELSRNQKDQTYFSTSNTIRDTSAEVPAILRSGLWESSELENINV